MNWRDYGVGTHLRFSLTQSFSFKPGSSIQLARLSVSMEPSMACTHTHTHSYIHTLERIYTHAHQSREVRECV